MRTSNRLADWTVAEARSTRLEGGLHAPGLKPREIKERVDKLQEPQAVALSSGKRCALSGRKLRSALAERFLQRAKDQGQRRAEFVTDVRKEVCFGLVELRQLLVRVAELAVCLGDFARSLIDASLEFIVPPAQFSRLPALSHAGLALHASQKADANARCHPDKLARQAAAVGDVGNGRKRN